MPVPAQSVESRAAAAGGPGRHPGDLRGAGGGPRHEARVVPQQGAAPLQVQLHPRLRLRLRGAQHHQGGRTDSDIYSDSITLSHLVYTLRCATQCTIGNASALLIANFTIARFTRTTSGRCACG